MSTPTAPKPMDPFELEACERYIKGGEMLMGAPGDIERQLSDWCEALLGARDRHAAEAERLRPLADAPCNALALTARELRLILMGLRSRSDSHPLDLPGNAPEALALDARVVRALAGVSPRASEGAATPTQEELDVSAERQLLAQYAAAGEAGRAGGLVAVIEVAATPTPCAVCGWACMGHATSEPERGEP